MFHSQWGIIKNAGVPRWQTIYQNISSSWNSGTDGLPLSKFWIWDQKVERWSHQYIIVRHFFEPKPHEAEYELRYVPLNPFRSLPRLPRFKWEKKTRHSLIPLMKWRSVLMGCRQLPHGKQHFQCLSGIVRSKSLVEVTCTIPYWRSLENSRLNVSLYRIFWPFLPRYKNQKAKKGIALPILIPLLIAFSHIGEDLFSLLILILFFFTADASLQFYL